MSTLHVPKKRLINRHVFMARVRLRWPFIIWITAVVLSVVIYFHGGRFGGMAGAIFVRSQTVAPLETGLVNELLVTVGDVVHAGDLLVKMDTSIVEAERDLIIAQMHNTVAEVKAEEVQNLRRFDSSIIRLESEFRKLDLKYTTAVSQLNMLRPEYEKMEKLFAARLIEAKEMISLRMEIAVLESMVETHPIAMEQITESLQEAQRQKAEISEQSRNSIALIEQEARQQEMFFDARVEACNLRAWMDGTVSRVYYYPGDTVPEGLPVVATVVSEPQQVVGFLSEYNARDVTVGMKAFMTSQFGHGPVVEAEIVALTPEIYRLPVRASPNADAEQVGRGRRAILRVTSESHLLPGESVNIYFHRPWRLHLFSSFFEGKSKGATE